MNYKKHAQKIADCCKEFSEKHPTNILVLDIFSAHIRIKKRVDTNAELKAKFINHYNEIGILAKKHKLNQDYIFNIIFGI